MKDKSKQNCANEKLVQFERPHLEKPEPEQMRSALELEERHLPEKAQCSPIPVEQAVLQAVQVELQAAWAEPKSLKNLPERKMW